MLHGEVILALIRYRIVGQQFVGGRDAHSLRHFVEYERGIEELAQLIDELIHRPVGQSVLNLPRLASRDNDEAVPRFLIEVILHDGITLVFHYLFEDIEKIRLKCKINHDMQIALQLMSIRFQRYALHGHHAVSLYVVGLIIDRCKYRHALLPHEIGFCEVDGKKRILVIHRERHGVPELWKIVRVNAAVEDDRGILYLIDEVLLEL